jgi:hypothetical protein
MTFETFASIEVLQVSKCLDRVRELIKQLDRAMVEKKNLTDDQKRRIRASRIELCDVEPRLCAFLLEHA